MTHEPTHLDLFSGIGGFALAAQACGWRTVAFCEIEPFAQRLLAERFGAVAADADSGRREQRYEEERGIPIAHPRLHPDIRALDGTAYRGVHLLTGGFPCQPYSLAGKRGGAGDDRALWPQMLRVIQESRPTWVLGENVAGFVSMGLDNALSDLEGIGYSCRTFVVPACAVGAGHRRDRVWIVGHDNSVGHPGSVHEAPGTRGRRTAEPRPSDKNVAHDDREQSKHIRDSAGETEWTEARRATSVGGCGSDVADAAGVRRQNGGGILAGIPGPQIGATRPETLGGERNREAQPRMGGKPYGLPSRLDVAPPGQDQHEWEAPRTAAKAIDRTNRLKALGNAIVPEVARRILAAIAEIEGITP